MSLTRLAAAGLSAVLLFATTACAATSPAETEPDNKTSVPAPTGQINVVASLNQWGSLAAELGGDDVEVTSIVNSTNVDAHDFEALRAAFKEARETKGMPTAIIAKTVKGKGVSFMENVCDWHGKAPNDEQYEKAMKALKLEETKIEHNISELSGKEDSICF